MTTAKQSRDRSANERIAARWCEGTPEERQAQQAARHAVLEIPHFPELEKRLIRLFGFSSAVVFMHQMIWWFGRSKMADRWTMYKTAGEWYEERGLNRKALKRARERTSAAGIITEKKGNFKKIHYRIDWVRLADLLRLVYVLPDGEHTAETEKIEKQVGSRSTPLRCLTEDEKDGRSAPLRVRSPNVTLKGSRSIDTLGARSNAEDYAEDQRTVDYALQASADTFPCRPADASIDAKYSTPPEGGCNTSILPQLLPRLGEGTKTRIRKMIVALDRVDDITRFSDHHLDSRSDANGEPFTAGRVADKVWEHLSGEEDLAAYMPWVQQCLEERRVKRQEASS